MYRRTTEALEAGTVQSLLLQFSVAIYIFCILLKNSTCARACARFMEQDCDAPPHCAAPPVTVIHCGLPQGHCGGGGGVSTQSELYIKPIALIYSPNNSRLIKKRKGRGDV